MSKVDVAIAVIQSDKGRYLLGRRPEGKHLGGKWELPGGKIDKGDEIAAPGPGSVYRAASREVMEELGLSDSRWYPEDIIFKADIELCGMHESDIIYDNKCSFYFCASGSMLPENTVFDMNSHTELAWCTVDDALQKDLCVADRYFFEWLRWLKEPVI